MKNNSPTNDNQPTSLRLLTVCIVLLFVSISQAQHYRNPSLPIDERVNDLLSCMTPEEKFWQLFMLAGEFDGDPTRFREGLFGLQMAVVPDSVDIVERVNIIQRHFVEHTRLGIPVIIFAEALHGLIQQNATVYPQAIGLAASFDTTLMHDVARAIAQESRRIGVRQVLSPVINIATDVRWGRTEETYGEDPYLTSEMGAAFVSEFEHNGIIATPKHFVANIGDGGRDSYPIQISERNLRETHLPPFEVCIKRGGARSVMTSYNSYDGSPCSASDRLNNQLLKQELGFRGFVISDAGAVGGANVLHFTASDYSDASAKALNSGLDVIFQTSIDHTKLFIPPFLDGRIEKATIDSAVARVLRAKFQLGLFENPFVEAVINNKAIHASNIQLARRAAIESIVLLKNENESLPLTSHVKSIAVIGPDADTVRLGGYSAPCTRSISIFDGIRAKASHNIHVYFEKGCNRNLNQYAAVPSAQFTISESDTSNTGLKGEYFNNIRLTGNPVLTRVDPSINFAWTLFSPDPEKLTNDFYSIRWTGAIRSPVTGVFKFGVEGNDGYRLYLNDTLLIDNWHKTSYRVVTKDVNFLANKPKNLRLEYFEPTGNARIKLIWNVGVPSDEEIQLQKAVDLAARCDVTVMAVGIDEGEFQDRSSLSLPGRQEELISRVAALGKPMIVVLVGGSAIKMTDWINQADAVLSAWYPGEQGGVAIAEVLFGEVNPAGRLPITIPLSEGQLPLVYNHKPTGRGDDYIDLSGNPQFPFGHGLSFSTFEYSNISIEPPVIKTGKSTIVRFSLKNSGSRSGDEVVQLYIRDELSTVTQPVILLKGFQRIHLEPGESRDLSFEITPELLQMYNQNLQLVIEPGTFRIMIGASSKEIRLRAVLKVEP